MPGGAVACCIAYLLFANRAQEAEGQLEKSNYTGLQPASEGQNDHLCPVPKTSVHSQQC